MDFVLRADPPRLSIGYEIRNERSGRLMSTNAQREAGTRCECESYSGNLVNHLGIVRCVMGALAVYK